MQLFPVKDRKIIANGLIKRTGFNQIKIGTFHGGHEVNDARTSLALR